MSETRTAQADVTTAHQDLHSEQGALRGEHPGRSPNPVIKVADLAWVEFEKPDLDRAEIFARDFGFSVAARGPDALWLRGTFAGSPCVVIRRGRTSRFITREFLGTSPSPAKIRELLRALRDDSELDPARLLGLLKAMNP